MWLRLEVRMLSETMGKPVWNLVYGKNCPVGELTPTLAEAGKVISGVLALLCLQTSSSERILRVSVQKQTVSPP
jgi:hypothetical protein